MPQLKDSLQFDACTPGDYGVVAEIYNAHIRGGQATMDQQLKAAKDIEGWVQGFHQREALYVLKRAGEAIGWGIIKRYSEREGYRKACETAIYLKPEETRKGYGTLMKKELLKRCQAFGYHHLVAKIFAVNEASIAYNLRLGYEIVGVQKEIGWVNGQWMDIVIMQYLFPDHSTTHHQTIRQPFDHD